VPDDVFQMPTTGQRFGAFPEEWAALKRLAKVDLLPVVSNPEALISPTSSLKAIGKTPSIYNHNGHAVGIQKWTDWETTVPNIEAWSKEEDYGVCIQTRKVRALDLDVPDLLDSERVVGAFLAALGLPSLPTRRREGTGKLVLAFVVGSTGTELRKRNFKTEGGLVELLATKQQFVAVGTHPSGTRYEWVGGLPESFPVISLEDFERAWAAIVAEFAIPGSEGRASDRGRPVGDDLDVDDPVADHLLETWEHYGIQDGKLFLQCPWFDGHSSDSGETEAAWLLAGTGGYRHGHFKCQHASCAGRKDNDFFEAVGYRPAKATDFPDAEENDRALAEAYAALAPTASAKAKEIKTELRVAAPRDPLQLPPYDRDGPGRIETNLNNTLLAIGFRPVSECDLAFDEFRGEGMIADQPGEWRTMADSDAGRLRIRLEASGFKEKIGKELMRDALEIAFDDRKFDTAQTWLDRIVPDWDGVKRVERFWPDYMKTADTPYTRALGRYSWTAQAGRVLDPGLKVDMVPVLVGPEGYRKSTAISLIPPSEDFFSEFNLHLDDEKLSRLMRGCLVGELAELRGVSARDAESVLAWITRTHEKWTPKFKEYAISLARRVVFYGTTNHEDFLQPHMGKRRWLPAMILNVIDTDAIVRDRLQLWAEARDIYLADGLQFAEVEELAKAERGAFEYNHPWADKIEAWIMDEGEDGVSPLDSGALSVVEVLTHCVGIEARSIKKHDEMQVAAVLTTLGLTKKTAWVKGKARKVWVREEEA
jgi:hypothetical protein